MSKCCLGTFQTNTSVERRRALHPVSRTLKTDSAMAVVEYFGGGGTEEIKIAADLVNDLILSGWRDILENKD